MMDPPPPCWQRCRYRVLVPVFWMTGVSLGFHYPGDEYGLWVISALPGAWFGFLFPNVGDIGGFAPQVVVVGGLCMAVVGWVMDGLRMPFRPWMLGIVLGTVGLCFQTIAQYPSYERAMGKNGSLAAYVLFGWNVSVAVASLFGIAVTALARWFTRRSTPRV